LKTSGKIKIITQMRILVDRLLLRLFFFLLLIEERREDVELLQGERGAILLPRILLLGV